jgi:hypothetical protein
MDGMAEMLSSDHQECISSQPVPEEQETEYMHYTRPAHMTQSMPEGGNRRPCLPTPEVQLDADAAAAAAGQHALSSPHAAAASCIIVEEPADDGNRVGVIADSVPAGIRTVAAGLSLSHGRNMSAPGGGAAEGGEAQRLAQRALQTLKSQKASMQERGSWPGGKLPRSVAFMLLCL